MRVKAPKSGVQDYLTPGKVYDVLSAEISDCQIIGFIIMSDTGSRLYCLPKNCYHICRQDWEQVESGIYGFDSSPQQDPCYWV
jgi:hypothetical protein